MSNLGFRVISKREKNKNTLINQFNNYSTANIADCMNRFFCVDSRIKLINQIDGMKMVGQALTVKTRSIDNLMIHKAIDMAVSGDIIVIDTFGDTQSAVIGEIMTRMAMLKKISGFLIDGCIRDYAEIKNLNLPIFAKGITPRGPYKDGPGEINVQVSCGGVVINPGDIIVGDYDGVVVIPTNEVEDVLLKVRQKKEVEIKRLESLKHGNFGDRSWIDRTLLEKGCKI